MQTKHALTVEEKQEILFEIMKDIDSFCRKNNIKYSISDGTMLGAIRHGGFIPWDDDADICMLREDFDLFAATYKSDRFQMLYKTETESEFFYGGYIKINDPQTCSGSTNKSILFKHGVTVDIFPFDEIPEDEKMQKKRMHRIRSIDNRLYHSQKKDLISILKSYRHDIKGWWTKLDSVVHDGKYKDSPLVGQSICVKDDRIVLRKELFDNIIDIPFNGHNFRGFADSHEYLEFMFGPDYMTPKKWVHGYIIFRK